MDEALERVLRLVSQGTLTPAEAEPIIAALSPAEPPPPPPPPQPPGPRADEVPSGSVTEPVRGLRIQTFEKGRQTVNLRVPLGIGGLAASLVPGLSEANAERIRAAMRAGARGAIIDVEDEDGDRVVISTE